MKKYKQVVAALLAMNLTVYVMPTGVINISAAVESQGNGDTTEEIQTNSAEDANAVNDEEDLTADADISDDAESAGTPASDDAADTVEITDENTDNAADTLDEETSEGEEISQGTDDLFSDGTQQDTATAPAKQQSEEISEAATQASNDGKLDLEQLAHYEASTQTMTVDSNIDLILLSNCDQEKVANIKIDIVSVGEIDVTGNKIPKGTDLSRYLKATASVVSNEENQSADASEMEPAEQSEDTEVQETENTDVADTADVQDADASESDENITQADDSAESTEDNTQNAAVQSVTAERDYTYQGIGDAEHPFQGEISGTIPGTFKIDNSLFGGLSSKAKITTTNNTVTWCGTSETSMLAKVYQFDSNPEDGQDSHALPFKMQGDTSAVMGSLIGIVKASEGFEAQVLKIDSNAVAYGSNVTATSASGNSGLICETLESGTICLDGYTFPENYTVQSTAEYKSDATNAPAAGNAGGVIGVMKTGTTLDIKSAIAIKGAKITSDKGNAGGIVGLMQQGATIKTEAAATLDTPIITGSTTAGGVAGMAEDVTFADSDITAELTVTKPTITGSNAGASAGGFVGKYTLNAANLVDPTNIKLPDQLVIDTPTLAVNNNGLAGGYFGYLNLNGNLTYTVSGTDSTAKKEIKPIYKDCSARALGAIAGKVTNTEIAGTLVIQNISVDATKDGNKGINYHGGLVGELGSYNDSSQAVYLKVSDCDMKVKYPHVSESSNQNGFGGIVGMLASESILKTENTVKITTSDAINWGGGIVGYAEKSVIDLTGTTDLSGTTYQENRGKNAQAGRLVGKQDCALIYAEGDGNGHGWSYIRGKENTSGKTAMNDIGNYGQIIRLHSDGSTSKLSSDLLSIDANHVVNYKEAFTMSGDTILIGSEDEFALLSIFWNSRGYFSADSNITGDSFSSDELRSKNITLSADIDLTGSGIAGLTRDTKTTEDTYKGTFDGGSHTIKLAIGETFGYKQDDITTLAADGDDGYGEVISAGETLHGRQGLFARVTAATIKNLTIDGNINISNAGKDILAGGIAGDTGNEGGKYPNVSGVTVKETIQADCEINQTLIVGGFYGGSYGGETQFGTLNDDTTLNTASATIKIQNCTDATDDTKIYAGGVIGEVSWQGYKFRAYNLKVGGSITTAAKKRAYVGGLIGIINTYNRTDPTVEESRWMEIKSVTFDGFKIDAPDATEMCGGLFGSIWSNVGLFFMKENGDDGSNTKLDVKDAEINAPNAEDVGGLAYRSSGNWEIRDHGINLEKLTIHAKKNVGLLVCHGALGTETVAAQEWKFGALYLSTTKYWESSYQISKDGVNIATEDGSGVFDEFVAYTTPSAEKITDNGTNGVISIATQNNGNGRVGVDESGCTTYQNRTTYGKAHPTNACSRYYYDLDQCLTDMATGSEKERNKNNVIDTPQELLLWSVYNYAYTNIGKFFTRPELNQTIEISDIMRKNGDLTSWTIGDKALDMQKYSYYPIDYSGLSVNIRNTTVKFWNKEIEEAENAATNKSTQGTDDNHTQHYTMHCGLFLTFQTPQTALTVNTVTFAGSIGKVNNNSSGVLVARNATGYIASDNTPRIVTVRISNATFDGLKVNGYEGEEVSPLLINHIGQYLTLDVNNITTKVEDNDGNEKNSYTGGTAVASSLIGTVGSSDAKQINLSFLNVILPDKKADGTQGIFSHATLLESFAYAKDDITSSAAYNFYNGDDWSGTNHIHKVTYGKEITKTTEFTDLQKWYYDEDTYRDTLGLVYDDATNKTGFSAAGYLPYVCTAYNEENCTHEIKVNQRVTDIVHGCGTYGHPYQITSEEEMNILADYMATGNPRKDWRVTVTRNQANYHLNAADNSETDITYQYNGTVWVQVENNKTEDGKDNWQNVKDSNGHNITIHRDFMYQYLLNAYYDIQGKKGTSETVYHMNLTDFAGFGTKDNPFRGVLTSSTGVTITLSGSNTSNGLIPYSYGSVIRKLNIVYSGTGKTLTYSNTSSTKYAPDVFFGGVIGCVMGGDNIIDGVTVDIADNWLTLDGDKKHLIQVGGYVGSVSGGGVIFRNMTDGNGLTDAKITNVSDILDEDTFTNLYVNPYVGRVLDGFAFYEKTSTDKNVRGSLINTDKNYTINTLVTTDENCVSMSGNTVTAKDAQGLLILSAIVNSGAASNGISHSYSKTENKSYTTSDNSMTYTFAGAYGKVRKADYTAVGESVTDANEALFFTKDDQTKPGDGSLPYLVQKYCGAEAGVFGISVNSDVEINLQSGGDFNLEDYGNGYQGITARYVSNTVRGETVEGNPNHADVIVPEVKSFNGNGNTVTMNMQVREYADDDFHAASVGGMFNVLRVSSRGTVSNLEIKSNTKNEAPIVSLTYYNAEGVPASISNSDWENSEEIGVGGFAGSLVGYTDEAANRDITVYKIWINGLTLDSPASVGGIFGNIGKPVKDHSWIARVGNNDIANLLQPQNFQMAYGIAFNDCNYSGLNATGKYAAGGFAGYLGNQEQNPRSSVNGNDFDSTVTNEVIGQSSAISATAESANKKSYAGGLFGYVGTRMFINMTDHGEKKDNKAILQDVSVYALREVGGCIGGIDSKCYGIHNVTVEGKTTTPQISLTDNTIKKELYAGGIVGYAKGEGQSWTPDWTYAGGVSSSLVKNVQINDMNKATKHDYNNTGSIQTNYMAGGITGFAAGGKTRIESCAVSSSKIYGSVAGGIVGQTDSEMQFVKCTTEGTSKLLKAEINGFSTASGILGFWKGGNAVSIQDCKVQYLNIEGKDWGVSALVGDCDGSGVGTLYLFNTSAQDSYVNASGNDSEGGGRWPCVGAIVGNLRNTVKASNVLFSGVELAATKGKYSAWNGPDKGLLFGTVTSNNIAVNIAGVSIQNIPLDNQTWNLTGGGSVSTDNDYIAFADYSGTALDDSKKGSSADLLVKDSSKDVAEPYVVTSPKNTTLGVYDETENATKKYLYGDGAAWTLPENSTSFIVNAKTIWDNRNNKVTDGHYDYNNITNTVSSFNFDSVISTYSANQETEENTDTTGDGDQDTGESADDTNQTTQKVTDFPVIQIGTGSADTVKDYLNILTNGAFSAANAMNTKNDVHVTATSKIYECNENGEFVKIDSNSASPAFVVNTDANTGKITFSTTTGYDNGKNRFNLLTVTFTEKDADKNEHKYSVQVPVLVRRMLEINFSATLTYGTNFREENYKDLKSHVLESFGSSITAYLKYTYNSDENGNYTEYGWQSYINAGGDVSVPMQRELCFKQGSVNLPTGTQLSLVDCRDGKVYYYTVDDPTQNIDLTAFKDSDGNAYNPPSIAELMKATAKTENGGAFVKVDKNGKPESGGEDDKKYPAPTVRIWNSKTNQYEYYRRADSGETGNYTITVDESKLKDSKNKSTVSESYYLVITVPKDSTSGPLNGSLQTSIKNSGIANQIHYKTIQGGDDDHNNRASTYLISKGYQQDLSENTKKITYGTYQKMSASENIMQVDVVDQITFPNSQAYLDESEVNDELYQRFVGSLQKNVDGVSSAEQFPSGTTGTANFYVYKKDGDTTTYYKYNRDTKKWLKAGTNETVAASYTWTSDGGNMELPLADETIDNVISLQGVRALVRDTNRTDDSTFYVEARMEAAIPAAGLNVIPESRVTDGIPTDYVKFVYSSQLSTEKTSLSYSTNRATAPDTKTAYYREEPEGAKLTYEADQLGQLGINLLDQQYLDTSEKHSLIDTTALYDLSSMKNLDNALKNSTGIKFTLNLSPKNTDSGAGQEDYQSAATDADKYLSVELKSKDSGAGGMKCENGTWTWTVPKATYWENDNVKTDSVFDGSILTQAIQLKVNVDNIEDGGITHFYSNYKVTLKAEILEGDNQSVGAEDDNIIYTLAKIKPEFVEPTSTN